MPRSYPLRPAGAGGMNKTVVNWNELDFAGFAQLAGDPTLTKYEKIGFPDNYRQGFEQAIFRDILAKLPRLIERELTVMDIGPGCSDLPHMILGHCQSHGHRTILIDSAEMLKELPDAPFIDKRAGPFPQCHNALIDLIGRVDVIICYSVLHYIYLDANPFDFIDRSLQLLAPRGEFLIGDIPNVSKRRRFFSSDAGVAFHQAFTGADTMPDVRFNVATPAAIDDSVILGLVYRARAAGADAYLLQQPDTLPMSNRREDILIRRP
jgi:hypothetical protein